MMFRIFILFHLDTRQVFHLDGVFVFKNLFTNKTSGICLYIVSYLHFIFNDSCMLPGGKYDLKNDRSLKVVLSSRLRYSGSVLLLILFYLISPYDTLFSYITTKQHLRKQMLSFEANDSSNAFVFRIIRLVKQADYSSGNGSIAT